MFDGLYSLYACNYVYMKIYNVKLCVSLKVQMHPVMGSVFVAAGFIIDNLVNTYIILLIWYMDTYFLCIKALICMQNCADIEKLVNFSGHLVSTIFFCGVSDWLSKFY